MSKPKRQTAIQLLELFSRELRGNYSPFTIPWANLTQRTITSGLQNIAKSTDLRTANAVGSLVAKVLYEGHRTGLIGKCSIRNIRSITRPACRSNGSQILSDDAMARLLGVCERDPSVRGARDGAIIGLLGCLGLELREVASLAVEDVPPLNYANPFFQKAITRWSIARPSSFPGPFVLSLTRSDVVRSHPPSSWAILAVLRRRCRQAGLVEKVTLSMLRKYALVAQPCRLPKISH